MTRPPPLRFVVLHHTGIDNPHFDLMYESSPGSALTTWRLPIWPIATPTPIERLGDHRREYLTYQGPLTKNRGEVRQILAGACQLSRPAAQQIMLQLDSAPTRLLIDESSPSGPTASPVGA